VLDGLLSLLTPAAALSVLFGALNTCLYVLIRGRLGLHVLLVLPAAILGAYAGQALGTRLGDILVIGDFSVLWASAVAWVGIGSVALASTIASGDGGDGGDGGDRRPR
jgi:hypothetical protein